MTRRKLLALGLAAVGCLALPARAQEKVLCEKQSPFNLLVVNEDERGLRTLRFGRDGVRQSVVKVGDPDHLDLPYARSAFVGLAFCPQPRRVLIVGLGGGTLPGFLHKHFPRTAISVVDIDPGVVEVAKEYFGFREDDTLHAHVADGRKFIEDCSTPYDMIFLDAFSASEIPYSLATIEFLQAVRRALTPEGVVVGNVWSRESNALYDSMVRTYQEVFHELYVLDVRLAGNKILLALPRKERLGREDLTQRARRISSEKRFRYDLGDAANYGYNYAGEKDSRGKVLKDAEKPAPKNPGSTDSTSSTSLAPDERALDVGHRQNTTALLPHDVFEITFTHPNRYANPFFDASVEVTFTAPSGKEVRVGGFHYGALQPPKVQKPAPPARGRPRYVAQGQDTWKARLAPWELGTWKYAYVFTNVEGQRGTGAGSFRCVKGRVTNPGFLRQHPSNPFRWVFDDGSPFFGVGLQECLGDGGGTGSALAAKSMEGPFRTDRPDLVKLLPGPLYVRGPSMNPQNADVYFRRYGRCGFNLFRMSQRNCSYDLFSDLDHYLVQEAVMTDDLLRHVRKYGYRVMYGLFGYQKVFNDHPDDAAGMAKVKRFIKYSVDRWGAFTDIWEFLNEQKAADGWYAQLIPYLRSIDPYRHPITTSWERPELDGIEVNAPHWYGNENELQSDAITAAHAKQWKKHGKPVIVGEQGNSAGTSKDRPPGIGGVWDAGSARRMRLRLWSAFFHEMSLIFWNTSYARDGHHMNIWLGPREREYVRALQDFCYRLDADVRMTPVHVSAPTQVRAYGLRSRTRAGVYLHHYQNHEHPVRDVKITLDVPAAATGYWYAPETAAILGRSDLQPGQHTLTAPPFTVDLALLITPDGPPDIDRDGVPNDRDPDNDNDGVPDVKDAFPLEPEEWADKDGDLIGDNLDADIDGDGRGDDRNGNGIPDHEEMDFDGDGVPRANAVPWDAFPLDPKEWSDTDGDGIGDNADPDIDGDGFTNEEERQAGTDPKDRLSFPVKN